MIVSATLAFQKWCADWRGEKPATLDDAFLAGWAIACDGIYKAAPDQRPDDALIAEAREYKHVKPHSYANDLITRLANAVEQRGAELERARNELLVVDGARKIVSMQRDSANAGMKTLREDLRTAEAEVQRLRGAEQAASVRCGDLLLQLGRAQKELARQTTPFRDFIAELAEDDVRCNLIAVEEALDRAMMHAIDCGVAAALNSPDKEQAAQRSDESRTAVMVAARAALRPSSEGES